MKASEAIHKIFLASGLLDKGHLASLLYPHLFSLCFSHTHALLLGLSCFMGAEASQLKSNKAINITHRKEKALPALTAVTANLTCNRPGLSSPAGSLTAPAQSPAFSWEAPVSHHNTCVLPSITRRTAIFHLCCQHGCSHRYPLSFVQYWARTKCCKAHAEVAVLCRGPR